MTMTILERLQSRISLRRNLISQLEREWYFGAYEYFQPFGYNPLTKPQRKALRKDITQIGNQQKLDKNLFSEIINLTRYSERLANVIREQAVGNLKGD